MNSTRAASSTRTVRQTAQTQSATPPQPPARSPDSVDISASARAATGQVRTELVSRVKQEIADGTYLTEDKLAVAADAIVREFNS